MSLKVGSASLKKVEEFCLWEKPYDKSELREDLFFEAMQELTLWHYRNCPSYRRWCDYLDYSPLKRKIENYNDLVELPYLFANVFKENVLKSIPDEEVILHLTSSGTSGQKSQMFFDEWSIKAPQLMLDRIVEHYQWVDQKNPVNYLLYTYEPEEGSHLGTAYTDNYLCRYTPIKRVEYALKYLGKKEGHKFDLFGTIKVLQEYAEEGLPVRIFGFPSFFTFTLQHMEKRKIGPLKLHPQSMTFFGGGWKGLQDQAIEKSKIYEMAEYWLGLKNSRCRDGFGSVEHCIPYVECENHHFHIPVYSEVIVRDPHTFDPLPYGEVGYLNFLSPYITSVPAHNVVMGDFAQKFPGKSCGCSLQTDYFNIVGRAGLSKSKSCAISASDLLQEFSQ